MGLSSSTSTNKPIYAKELTGAAGDISGAYHTQAPKITGITDQLGAQAGGLVDRYNKGDPNVNAASQFNQDVLGGKYLGSNPFQERQLLNMNNDIRNQTQASAGVHGNWGDSSELADIASRNIANNENAFRSHTYDTGMGLMGQQAALAPDIAQARYQPLDQLTNIAQAQNMPVQAAVGAGNGVGGLLGQYAKTKSKQAWGPALIQGASNAANAAAMCDVRTKTDIRRVGATDAGLPIYSFRYHGDSEPRMGPMAHEVAAMQPDNLGPVVGGYQTVKLGSVR